MNTYFIYYQCILITDVIFLQNYKKNDNKFQACMKKNKNEANKKNSFSINVLTSIKMIFLSVRYILFFHFW